MRNKVLIRKLDKLGRITIPSEIRRNLDINDLEDLEVIADKDKIIIKKLNKPDIFGNKIEDDCYFEYLGNKISKKSVIELSKIAGILE